MNDLVVAALVFLGTHVGISSTPLRAQLVASIGERPYQMLYSLVALVTIIWLALAYAAAPVEPLWSTEAGWRDLPLLIMPLALFLLVSSLSGPNPTAVGQAIDADAPEPATGILRVTRHPFMWAVGLWALAHILANGDLASLVFFGALALLAIGGARLIDVKRSRQNAPGWGIFMQRTSNLPLAAVLQGRQRVVWRELGRRRVAITAALYGLLLWLHPWLFGVPAWPH